MSVQEKNTGSDFESDSRHLHLRSQTRAVSRVDAVRSAATLLALLMGLVIVGVAGNSIYIYNATHFSSSPTDRLWLSMWPDKAAFDIRPTVALAVGSAIVVLANIVALATHPKVLRHKLVATRTTLTFVAPFVGLAAAVVAMAFYYAVNTSRSADTLLSWSCRWRAVSMEIRPHFGTLCRTSRAGVYLSILLIPVEAAALALAAWQLKIERFATARTASARSSPTL